MKIFIYKTLIIAFVSLIIFEVLIGRRINSIESQIYHLKSKQNIEQVKTKIFNEIKKLKPIKGREIHITDAIRNLILKGDNFFANIFQGKYLDCGTLQGYINSGLEISKGNK